MGGCFSKKKSSSSIGNTVVTPSCPQFDLHQNVTKTEVFVIKHRISHETDRHSGKEEVSSLSRSKSTGTQNPPQHSLSKRSFDFDLNTRINNANEEFDDKMHWTDNRFRQGSRRREERSSRKERRISISPSWRSESPSPSPSLRTTVSRPPAKLVTVPPTHKTNNAAAVKRIHVKRNVSPVRRRDLCVYTETRSQEQTQQQEGNTRAADQRRKSPSNTKITPTYASLLLEDIHNFHQKNTDRPASSPQAFALPECVNKAYSIMEAVADLNSNTRWRNPINGISAAKFNRSLNPRLPSDPISNELSKQ